MKKAVSVIVLLVLLISLFTGCQAPYDSNKLYTELPSEEVFEEMFIALSYKNYYVDLRKYPESCPHGEWSYGTINDCIVAGATTADIGGVTVITIADYVFEYGRPFHIFVYKDGEGCTLQEAYEQGWLTKEHIEQLHVRHPRTGEERLQITQEYKQNGK